MALLIDALPELAKELSTLLMDIGKAELAEQIPSLPVIDRCRCGDDFCATIYTVPHPVGLWGPGEETISLDPDEGLIIIDVANNRITAIEILYRDEIRKKLLQLLPEVSVES